MFFKHIEGEAAVIIERGIYRQTDLYERNGFLYAKIGTGFVRLFADGSTTKAKARLDAMSWEGNLARDGLGRLCRPTVSGSTPLPGDRQQALIAAAERATA